MLFMDTCVESFHWFQVAITTVTSEAQLELVMSRQLTISNSIRGIWIKRICVWIINTYKYNCDVGHTSGNSASDSPDYSTSSTSSTEQTTVTTPLVTAVSDIASSLHDPPAQPVLNLFPITK